MRERRVRDPRDLPATIAPVLGLQANATVLRGFVVAVVLVWVLGSDSVSPFDGRLSHLYSPIMVFQCHCPFFILNFLAVFYAKLIQ